MKATIEPAATRQRLVFLDWLRILAVLLLVPFHVARLFDVMDPFYVKNAELSLPLTAIIGLLSPWHMPLLFMLAGAATGLALGFRSSGGYVVERIKRLLIPFLFGVLVVVPPQMYFAQRHHAGVTYSYSEYYPSFFTAPGATDFFGQGLSFAHLWFIFFLFFISLVALPLIVSLRTPAGRRLVDRFAALCERPGVLFLMLIPLIIGDALPSILGKEGFLYLVVFVYGYILLANSRFEQILDRNKLVALILAAGSMTAFFALILLADATPGGPGFVSDMVDLCGLISMWSWLIAFLGFGRWLLNRFTRGLGYINEMVYPFYLLHQTVIVVLGYYVVQWNLEVNVKFALIVLASFALTIAIYDLSVRRLNVLRFLFGMKQKTRSLAAFDSALAQRRAA